MSDHTELCQYCGSANHSSVTECPLINDICEGGDPGETVRNRMAVVRILDAYLRRVHVMVDAALGFQDAVGKYVAATEAWMSKSENLDSAGKDVLTALQVMAAPQVVYAAPSTPAPAPVTADGPHDGDWTEAEYDDAYRAVHRKMADYDAKYHPEGIGFCMEVANAALAAVRKPCPNCSGVGHLRDHDDVTCKVCNGTGKVTKRDSFLALTPKAMENAVAALYRYEERGATAEDAADALRHMSDGTRREYEEMVRVCYGAIIKTRE